MKIFFIFVFFIGISGSFCCKKNSTTPNPPNLDTIPVTNTFFAKGSDISWVTQMESSGMKFYNSNGTEQECISVLKDLGMNSIRLRVWVNPADNYNNTADVVAKAIRAKNAGMKIMIDFHY